MLDVHLHRHGEICGGVLTGSAVFVAPHLDDAALSCGGGIAHLIAAGVPVTVVTAYTAGAPEGAELSDLAQRIQTTWVADARPYRKRQTEDLSALGDLGADVEHLGLRGAIYRTSPEGDALYSDLHGPIAPYDRSVFVRELEEALLASKAGAAGARVFCPIGAGRHVDHIRTRIACEQAFSAESLVYYSDYPYSARSDLESDAAPAGFESHVLPLAEPELSARIATVAQYESQLGLFATRRDRYSQKFATRLPFLRRLYPFPPDTKGRRAKMEREVRRDVEAVGGERYWWMRGTEPPFPAKP